MRFRSYAYGGCRPGAETTDYPTRAVRLIVPFAPGGGVDIVARLIAPKLSDAWKHSVVIDNRDGGGTTIGTGLAARAEPDGHTLVMVTATFAINPSLYKKLAYDSVRDFAPVSHQPTHRSCRRGVRRKANH